MALHFFIIRTFSCEKFNTENLMSAPQFVVNDMSQEEMLESLGMQWYKPSDKPKPGKWIVIEYISEDKNNRGEKMTEPGYYSDSFDTFYVHEPIFTSCARAVTPLRWRYL